MLLRVLGVIHAVSVAVWPKTRLCFLSLLEKSDDNGCIDYGMDHHEMKSKIRESMEKRVHVSLVLRHFSTLRVSVCVITNMMLGTT